MPFIVFSLVMIVAGIRNLMIKEVGSVPLGLCRIAGVLAGAALAMLLENEIVKRVNTGGFTLLIFVPYLTLAVAEGLGRHLSNSALEKGHVRLRQVDGD